MKKNLVIILFLFSFLTAKAQEAEDVGWVARFGIAGGVNPAWIFPNLDPLNKELSKIGMPQISDKGMMLWGGGGYAYIMLIDNLRLGGVGLSGSTVSSGKLNGKNTEVEYNYGLGGITAEYTLPFIKTIAVSPGVIVGVASSRVLMFQNNNSINWSDSWTDLKNSSLATKNISKKFVNTFFTITPTVNIDLPLSRFMALRLGAGYIYSFNDKWKADNDVDAVGVPSDFKSNTFFIQAGLYFGFFAF